MLNKFAYPDSSAHGASMGPTWVLPAPDGPHAGPMNLAIRVSAEELAQWSIYSSITRVIISSLITYWSLVYYIHVCACELDHNLFRINACCLFDKPSKPRIADLKIPAICKYIYIYKGRVTKVRVSCYLVLLSLYIYIYVFVNSVKLVQETVCYWISA